MSEAFCDPGLTDEIAIEAMRQSAATMVEVTLGQRRALLAVGFAESHTFLRNLDRVAREMAEAHSVLRKMDSERLRFEKPSDADDCDPHGMPRPVVPDE